MANAFEGLLLKPGATFEEAALWPTSEYPAMPLLLEYAGTDRTGSGHRRSNDIYVLWRYDRGRGCWDELIRATSQGMDWIEQLKAVALQELGRTIAPFDASAAHCVSRRVLGALDHELEMLDADDRLLVMSFVYQEFTSRALAFP
jgi:hypothetical protein